MNAASERATLVKALSTVIPTDRQRARRFLQGLSTEELRYIAGYFGACLLEAELASQSVSRGDIAWEVLHYECCRAGEHGRPARFQAWTGPETGFAEDIEHKMILLVEYLTSCRCGAALEVAAGSA